MDKISITVNGKTFEAEGKDLFEIIDKFLNNTEEEYDDIPDEYEDYEDYLSIDDFKPSACIDMEKYDDLKAKLDKRLEWIKKHPKADLTDVKDDLDIKYKAIQEVLKRMDYVRRAYQAAQVYVLDVKHIDHEN